MKQQTHFFLIALLFITGCGMKSKEDLTENYDANKSGILELKNHYTEIVPKDYLVRIRYNSSDNIDLFVYLLAKNTKKSELLFQEFGLYHEDYQLEPRNDYDKIHGRSHELLFQQWDLDYEDYEPALRSDYDKKYQGITNSLELIKEKLNWTNNTFIKLYTKLENVNCIGISNRNPIEIEYGFKGMGGFSYLIFDDNLNSELQEKYSNDCSMLFYKENVVLQYESGAVGSFCIPEFKRTK
jgi:hypothetical protein